MDSALDNFGAFQEPEVDKESLRKRESELVKIIEAIKTIAETNEWSILKKLVFDGVASSLEYRLKMEFDKKTPDMPEINRLQGQLAWARRYVDFNTLADAFRLEISNLRKKL